MKKRICKIIFLSSKIYIMKQKLAILLLSIIVLSCNNERKQVQVIPLNFQTIKIDSLIIGQSYGMLLVDSNLLIADSQGDSLFHWINLNTLTNKDVGQIGQGPNEYLSFNNFYKIGNRYGFYDSQLRGANEILFSEKGIALKKKVRFESLDYRYYQVIPTALGTYIGTGPYKKGLFAISDSAGQLINAVGEQPYRDETERKIPELGRAMAYQGKLLASLKGDRLVNAIYTSPMIYFYQLSPTGVTLVNSFIECYPEYRPDLGDNSYASAMNRNNKLGYMDMVATEQYVYALYSGKSTAEAGLSAFCGNKIRVFDWNGNLQKEYIFDMDISCFCVTPDDRTIYAIGLVDDYELVKAEC